MKRSVNNKGKGFTLLYSLLVVSAVLTIALVVGDIILRELRLTATIRDSQIAFYAADTGVECALFWDKPLAGSAFGDFNVPETIRDQLLGHWKLDETGGATIAVDSSGFGNDGVTSGTPGWITGGKIGNAYTFDGSNDITNGTFSFISGGPITIAFWNNVAVAENTLAFNFGDTNESRVLSHAPWGNGNIYWDYGGPCCSEGRVFADYSSKLGKWTHVTLVSEGFGGNYQAIYLDGELAPGSSTSSDGPTSLQTGFNIGATHNGAIDDLRVYDRVLSESEIKALALLTPFTLPVDEGTSAGYMCNGEDINDETTGWDNAQGWIVTPQGDGASVWFDMEFSDGTCASVTVTKEPGNLTTIDSRGYNTCVVESPRRVERGLRATY